MKNILNGSYMVPFDFTRTTENAFKYSLNLIQRTKGKITLVHVVNKESDISKAKLKLEQVIYKLAQPQSKSIQTKVFVGHLVKDLIKGAKLEPGTVAVMGTHDTRGVRKLFKSRALKVISKADVPFIITQNQSSKRKIKTIVMPYSFAKESIQISKFAADLAKRFEATVHLIGHKHDDEWLQKSARVNQAIVKKYLDAQGVDYKAKLLNIKGSTYEKAILKYIYSSDADLIATTYYASGFKGLYNPFLQQMIENSSQIPVLTVNAQNLLTTSNYSFLSV